MIDKKVNNEKEEAKNSLLQKIVLKKALIDYGILLWNSFYMEKKKDFSQNQYNQLVNALYKVELANGLDEVELVDLWKEYESKFGKFKEE